MRACLVDRDYCDDGGNPLDAIHKQGNSEPSFPPFENAVTPAHSLEEFTISDVRESYESSKIQALPNI